MVSASYSNSKSIEDATDICKQKDPASTLPSLHSSGEARSDVDWIVSWPECSWQPILKNFLYQRIVIFSALFGICFWKEMIKEETVLRKVCYLSEWLWIDNLLAHLSRQRSFPSILSNIFRVTRKIYTNSFSIFKYLFNLLNPFSEKVQPTSI